MVRKTRNGICHFAVAVVVMAVSVCLLAGYPAQAAGSSNVVIIGGSTLSANGGDSFAANVMGCTAGGFLPVTGPVGELGDFSFTPMPPAGVSAASLAPFDTAVLNVASRGMCCNTAALSPQQKADLVAWVATGKKLIIYDSECSPNPVDFSWMPYPFTTSNPGAMGGRGTLTIVESSTLASSDPLSPYYINAVHLGANTDAVGDMNVMITYDSNWCINMSGTNVLNRTGPVHTYAKYPRFSDQGLFIYNGLDQDYHRNNDAWLRKMWLLELRQPFNPSGLPCGVSPIGIALEPETAQNPVGSAHTVVATLKDLLGHPQVGIQVTFTVKSGPNAGAIGACVPANSTTDANGQVSFTYTSNGQAGFDLIEACFLDQQGALRCDEAQKEWVPPIAEKDPFGFYVFDRGKLKPLTGGEPGFLCLDVATKGAVDVGGNKIKDPVTGCQKMEYDWTNSSFMWRKINAYFVQSVTLEKIHGMRKGACSLIWKNDYIRQQGKEVGKINLCWPLLYETEGTKWVLSIVYQANPAVPDPSGRSARVHKERYVWTVDWKARDFSEFRQRLLYFSKMPAGMCELFAVPPLELRSLLWVLDGYGCQDTGTYDPGITVLMATPPTDPNYEQNLQKAQDKAGLLEQLLDSDSCTDPCTFCGGLPCAGAMGISNTDRVPAGSVLLTDFYYAAHEAGLLGDR